MELKARQAVPDGYVRPSFPSLYRPTFRSTQMQVGVFLYEAEGGSRFHVRSSVRQP